MASLRVSVSKGRVFTIGNIDGKVVCTAISETDGKKIWSTPIGPAARETSVMRWLARTSPTVDGERIYAVTANGDYACLASDTGKEIWSKHFEKDFGGKRRNVGVLRLPTRRWRPAHHLPRHEDADGRTEQEDRRRDLVV